MTNPPSESVSESLEALEFATHEASDKMICSLGNMLTPEPLIAAGHGKTTNL